MSSLGPFVTRAGVLQRSTGFIDLLVRNTPDASAYRLYWSDDLDDAYGNLTDGAAGSGVGGVGAIQLLEAGTGLIAQTARTRFIGTSHVPENRKGQTSFQVATEDLVGSVGAIPDEDLLFFRVQERRKATGAWATVAGVNNNGWNIQGPILAVLPPTMLGSGTSTFSMSGVAPSNTACVIGSKPNIDLSVQVPLPMHIIFHRPASAILLRNIDAAGALLYSFGPGMPMSRIPQGEQLSPGLGSGASGIREIFLARELGNGGCAFDLTLEIDHGTA